MVSANCFSLCWHIQCGSAAYLEGGVYDVIGDPKMYRENGKKTYREFDQILRELPRGAGGNPVSVKKKPYGEDAR